MKHWAPSTMSRANSTCSAGPYAAPFIVRCCMKKAAALPCTVCTDPSGAGCFVWGASCAELCHIVSILTVPLLISFMICGRSELFGSVWLQPHPSVPCIQHSCAFSTDCLLNFYDFGYILFCTICLCPVRGTLTAYNHRVQADMVRD